MAPRKTEDRRAKRGYGYVPTSAGRGFTITNGRRNFPAISDAERREQERAARAEEQRDRERRAPAKKAPRPAAKKRTQSPAGGTTASGDRAPAKKAVRGGARRGAAKKAAAPAPARKSAAPAKAAGKTIRKNPGTTVTPQRRERTPIKRASGGPGAARGR